MKTFNVTLLCVALACILVAYQAAALGRGARRPPVDQDEGALDEVASPRRRQGSRARAAASDEESLGDEANGSAGDESADQQDYQAPPRSRPNGAGSRRRNQDQDLEDRPARRRQSSARRGHRNRANGANNGNNLNFNGLPDGFPSAAFGAGFGAAVSSGGRGRGPSNAAGFGAGFAQSGGGNALAGGFGSGLVNNGGGSGSSRNYDDDDDSDYDSGRSYSRRRTGYRD